MQESISQIQNQVSRTCTQSLQLRPMQHLQPIEPTDAQLCLGMIELI